MKTCSERHATKILNGKTGKHLFPSSPTITPKLWKSVQTFDTQRLLLAHFEGSSEHRKLWLESMEFFIPTELEPDATFGELVADFHNAGRSMKAVSRSNCRGLVLPSESFYKYLTVTKGLVSVKELMRKVDEQHAVFHALFHRTDTFNDEYPDMTIADKLQCMENFDRVDPLQYKCGVMLAKCTCNASYRDFCCVESLVFSMLYSPELVVPSAYRSKQLKEKTKAVVNPFNASKIRMEKQSKDKAVVPEPPTWAPNIPKSKGRLPDSAASIKRPASLKNKKPTDDAEGNDADGDIDAEGDVGRAVLDAELPTKEAQVPIPPVPRKRKAPSLPTIPRRQSEV
jgi:hypothetical protein